MSTGSQEVAKGSNNIRPRATFQRIPTFLTALSREESTRDRQGYGYPGYRFGENTVHLVPDGLNRFEWTRYLQELQTLVSSYDRDGIWQWYCETYPQAMQLVPDRGKVSFVEGVLQAFDDEQLLSF